MVDAENAQPAYAGQKDDLAAVHADVESANANADLDGLSKTQRKKLKRKQEWEDGREQRKVRRKEKLRAAKSRKREAYQADPSLKPKGQYNRPITIPVPVTIVIDCQFDDLMNDKEIISLGSQVNRCYSENRKAKYRPSLVISSFGGRLKERYDGLLAGMHTSWTNVKFTPNSLKASIEEAKAVMTDQKDGHTCQALETAKSEAEPADGLPPDEPGEVIYLTSDSPDTLNSLKPNSVYVIGGLVDKNRHKGICYKRALDDGIRTAKLPIGDFIKMSSRQILATNHVHQIMLNWLETGDWGEAFISAIPKRKGGTLKTHQSQPDDKSSDASEGDETAEQLQIKDDSENSPD